MTSAGSWWPRHSRRGARDERGSLAPAVPVVAFALLLLGGLGIDGSRQLNARGQAVAFAEEAARAGAQGVDIDADELVLDPTLARDRVADYCVRVAGLDQVAGCRFVRIQEVSGSDPRRIVVVAEVRTSIETSLLGLVGVRRLTASATGQARPVEGVDEPLD
ncbi:MAG: pilus assembly protein TadG-related protein [Nocardioides sp.]